ncbi:unnamed protein product [Leptosia nina]|uniref:Cilia- and flagella-associated protein 69 ARM repeats domain-containing protein n=1 Tax=Leptosia nina TaxID=320188 RepID=A0AAV1K0Y2_9NEOP
MDKKKTFTSTKASDVSPLNQSKKARDGCFDTKSTSHTQFYAKQDHTELYQRVARDEYLGKFESISGSSDTFHCVHGTEGKQYTKEGLLKRNLLKELDPFPKDPAWNDKCPPGLGREMVKMLEFMVLDPVIEQQMERFEDHLRDFARTSSTGYLIDSLGSVCIILEYLLENIPRKKHLREGLTLLLRNMEKPILLTAASDVVTHFEALEKYLGYMGYLLTQLEDDELFDIVSRALIWQLSAPDTARGRGAAHLRHNLAAAVYLHQTIVRMLALSTSHRYPTFQQVALLLALYSSDNCLEMVKENIIENVMYRFNPYFPNRKLPEYDINPSNPQDYNVKLGDSSINLSTTMSLLLVILKSTLDILATSPKQILLIPCPDEYSQRCFLWAFRYECRARDHKHERTTLTCIANALFRVFGDRLTVFSNSLMLDVLSLSVLSEVPSRHNWIRGVNFNTGQFDAQFKKNLIYLSVDFIKTFSYSRFAVESEHWLLGVMYLIDPGLSSLRTKWSPALFAELRKVALQALVCTVPLMPSKIIREYGLVRRLMWYIEWYSEVPFELPVLYWCVRVLQVSVQREPSARQDSIHDLFETHGIIILMHLCYTLLSQKLPPVEKSQAIIAVCLQLLTSAVQVNARITCCVYPDIKWPVSTGRLAKKMLNDLLYAMDKHLIVSDKWIISLVNFIWEAIIWKKEYREYFILQDGLYKLLDLITSPGIVNRGSTIAALLAAVFRDECLATKVSIDEYGVLQKDLSFKVNLADEAYKLYKNIQLSPEDEAILVLCSHFMTIKLGECWYESECQASGFLPYDEGIFREFRQINNGWAKQIQEMQERVIAKDREKQLNHEDSLYAFLGRVRLNIALDALREVKCVTRSADRSEMLHAMLLDAVQAHHRRSQAAKNLETTVLRTFGPALDDQNITGQYVKVYSIYPKNKPKPREDFSSAYSNN